jgi:hypothetical protein
MEEKSAKIEVSIYVPTSACNCVYEKFMERVFKVISPYRDRIDTKTKDANGQEGYALNIHQNTIVVENDPKANPAKKPRFTNTNSFKIYLKEYFTKEL